jgi:hypothetical protein
MLCDFEQEHVLVVLFVAPLDLGNDVVAARLAAAIERGMSLAIRDGQPLVGRERHQLLQPLVEGDTGVLVHSQLLEQLDICVRPGRRVQGGLVFF